MTRTTTTASATFDALDTSGVVLGVAYDGSIHADPSERDWPYMEWSDLDPFTQGYAASLLQSLAVAEAPFDGSGRGEWQWELTEAWRESDWWEGSDYEGRADLPAFRDHRCPGFSDLAPETLALILKDCASHPNAQPHKFPNDPERQCRSGRNFWEDRQDGSWGSTYPPLTPYLRDDGKVDLKESTPR